MFIAALFAIDKAQRQHPQMDKLWHVYTPQVSETDSHQRGKAGGRGKLGLWG